MHRNQNRVFRGNSSNRERNNDDRKPWKSNFNNGSGGTVLSPWISNSNKFNASTAPTNTNIPSLMSVFVDQSNLSNGGDNFQGGSQNRPRLNFTPPENNDGSYWRQCSDPFPNKNEKEPRYQNFGREDAHQGNFGREDAHQGNYGRVDAHQGNFGRVDARQGNFGRVDAHQGNFGRVDANKGNFGRLDAHQGNIGREDAHQGNFGRVDAHQGNFGRADSHRGNFRRQFDRRTPYDRPQTDRNKPPSRWESAEEEAVFEAPIPQPELSALEVRVEKLMNAVKSQPCGVGELVLLQNNNEIPPVLMHNAAHQVKNCVLAIDRDEDSGYSKLLLNGLSIAEGMYSSKKDAKEALYEMGLEELRGKCFFITSKCHFEEVSMEALARQKEEETSTTSGLEGSKAHQMMLKMGWGGKGLGTQEQGEQKTVADKITENITREGLGSKNVMQEVHKILYEYALSNKTTTLGFDSGFTKDERAQIHAIAAKYHLRSKSEGGFNSRRITVSKKKNKWMLVRELLTVGGENESYALTVPEEFEDMWKELRRADGVEV